MSYLASPPETPIAIDGGVEYTYVIAQQGAIIAAVVTDADFTFVLSPGEPAALRLTFSGTVTATPQYKTVTVNLTDSSGIVVAHTPQFMILGTGATQRVPNITTTKGRAVAPGQSVAIQVAADITPTSYGVSGLPAGLSLNTATGLITGAAPSTDGLYLITLQAINGEYHYYRYFVLLVGGDGVGTWPNSPFAFT